MLSTLLSHLCVCACVCRATVDADQQSTTRRTSVGFPGLRIFCSWVCSSSIRLQPSALMCPLLSCWEFWEICACGCSAAAFRAPDKCCLSAVKQTCSFQSFIFCHLHLNMFYQNLMSTELTREQEKREQH